MQDEGKREITPEQEQPTPETPITPPDAVTEEKKDEGVSEQ